MKGPECDDKRCMPETRSRWKWYRICPVCGGTGDARPSHGDWIPAKRRMRPCEHCDGSGYVADDSDAKDEPR